MFRGRRRGFGHKHSSSLTHYGHRRVPSLQWRSGLRESWFKTSMKVFTVFVDNLPHGMSNTWIKQIFKNDGRVVDAYVSSKERRNKDGKFAFVKFQKKHEAERAIGRNDGLLVRGRAMKVQWAKFNGDHRRMEEANEEKHVRSINKQVKVWRPAVRGSRNYKEVMGGVKKVAVEKDRVEEDWSEEALICKTFNNLTIEEFKQRGHREGISDLHISILDCEHYIVNKAENGVVSVIVDETKGKLSKFCESSKFE